MGCNCKKLTRQGLSDHLRNHSIQMEKPCFFHFVVSKFIQIMYTNRSGGGHHCLPRRLLDRFSLKFGSDKEGVPYRMSSDYIVLTKENASIAPLLRYHTVGFDDDDVVLLDPPIDDPIAKKIDLVISKTEGRSMERIGLKNPSCDCYMNASLHFLCASYYFIHRFCKMFETTNDAVLMSSIYEFLVGCDENRADVFKILMQKLCPEYVPGTQHDPFLFITDVICQLDAEIILRHNRPNYEEAISKHFAIYTQVSLKCKQGHKRTYFPDPGLVVSCPISCDTKTCSLPASFNQMFRKEKIMIMIV